MSAVALVAQTTMKTAAAITQGSSTDDKKHLGHEFGSHSFVRRYSIFLVSATYSLEVVVLEGSALRVARLCEGAGCVYVESLDDDIGNENEQ